MDSVITKNNDVQMTVVCMTKARDESVLSSLDEGVAGSLSKWAALQMTIQNRWGGVDPVYAYKRLISDVVSWFSQPRASLHVEDLENLLHENMLLSFNTDIEDGSIEEVAERLMIMHEEFIFARKHCPYSTS